MVLCALEGVLCARRLRLFVFCVCGDTTSGVFRLYIDICCQVGGEGLCGCRAGVLQLSGYMSGACSVAACRYCIRGRVHRLQWCGMFGMGLAARLVQHVCRHMTCTSQSHGHTPVRFVSQERVVDTGCMHVVHVWPSTFCRMAGCGVAAPALFATRRRTLAPGVFVVYGCV
jgi:hypothetical protein